MRIWRVISHKKNNYQKLDIHDVESFISNNNVARSSKTTYELSDNSVVKRYLKKENFNDSILEEYTKTYDLKGYDLFWFKDFPNAFDEVK